MKKYKIIKFKNLGNWVVYRRYALFFWYQENYFMSLDKALKYIGKKSSKIITEDEDLLIKIYE